MNFINFKNNKIVNLKNVSNIGFISNDTKNRVVFNMNYGVSLRDNYTKDTKIISDYVYWEAESLTELMEMRNLVLEKTKHWISYPYGTDYRIINPDEVSSVVFDCDEYKNRFKIIFNLSHQVSFKYGGTTSEFTFYKFNNKEDYSKCKDFIKDIIL